MSINKQQQGIRRTLVIGSLLVLAGLVPAGISFGSELLDYQRFSEAVETASAEAEAKGGAWPQLNGVCTPCHGADGNTINQLYPRLAGQPAAYLNAQLNAFASSKRPNPTMSSLAINLSPAEIEQLSAFFAAQAAEPNSTFEPDPQQRALGEQLSDVGNCAACHGAQLQGQGTFSRLAGQGYDYLVKQLQDFKTGARQDASGVMLPITVQLSEQDIASLATYLASLQGAVNAK
ncbi:MAG: c-type cytochrome [Pseudomonadales bacterium]